MSKRIKIFIKVLVSVLIVFQLKLSGQEPGIKSHRITTDAGLSQNSVNCIHQDKYGFMWFGTQDGLNRYDGYNFKVFRKEPGNENSISNNYIWTIYEDEDGIFWIGTFGGGLTRFDPTTESFINYKNDANDPGSLSNNNVFSIVEIPKGTLWIGTNNGLNKFDKKSGEIDRFLYSEKKNEGFDETIIGWLTPQNDSLLWMSSRSVLTRMNIVTGQFNFFPENPFRSDIPIGNVFHLSIDDNNLLLLFSSGLVKLDLENERSSMLLANSDLKQSTSQIIFQKLIVDDRGYYWIGTSSGLLLLEKESGKYHHFTNDADDNNSISHNSILSLYKSRDGIVWVGTRNGLNRIDKIKNDFILYGYNPDDKNSLSNSNVGPILEDSRGILWIGTSGGLNAYDKKRKEFVFYHNIPGNSNSISTNYILSLAEDSNGNIWVGTRGGGLNRLTINLKDDLGNISYKKFTQNNSGLSSNTIQFIYEDAYGIIWIGTGGGGLNRYDPETNKIKSYKSNLDGTGPNHPYVFCIYEDSYENFWLGTATGGINLFDRKEEKFLYMKNNRDNSLSLSNDIILSIYEDTNRSLWFGTAGGLNKFTLPLRPNLFDYIQKNIDVTNDSLFLRFGREQGLPNDVIYGILEDTNGNLWCSTNLGIIKINPNIDEPVVRSFNVSDGLQDNEFNQNAYFKDNLGRMYFGGVGGLNIFHPDSIKENLYIPQVVLTDFSIFNKSVAVGNASEETFSLEGIIHSLNEINLSYDDDVFSFEFASLNYMNPEKNEYAYMMEGFDEEWVYCGTRRFVTYTHLDPGEYTFRVRGSNNDGVWNQQGTAIKIYIPPPPWLSWYAYLLYAAICFAIVFLYIRYRIKAVTRDLEMQSKIERAKLEEREEVRKKSSADFHDEAGNKLTKISLFTELAKSEIEKNSKLKEYLHKIEENTKELSSGMRDFIWVLDPSKDTLLDTMNRLNDFGNSMFGYTDIKFNVIGLKAEMNSIVLSIDSRRALMLIFKEAMNNCLKYSRANNIEMKIKIENDLLKLSLNDDGAGFILNEKSNGYGLKNMHNRAEKMGGKLAIESSPGEGTKITLESNITHMGN